MGKTSKAGTQNCEEGSPQARPVGKTKPRTSSNWVHAARGRAWPPVLISRLSR